MRILWARAERRGCSRADFVQEHSWVSLVARDIGLGWIVDSIGLDTVVAWVSSHFQLLWSDDREALGPSTVVKEASRGRSALKDEGSLSDLLDLEIKWTSESEKLGAGVSNEASVRIVRPAEDKNSAAFSGWEAEFQNANSESVHEGSKEFDPFVGSTVDLSSHMDAVFGSGKDINSAHVSDDTTPASRTNDWIQDDLYKNLNSKVPAHVGQVDSTIQAEDAQNLAGPSSTRNDWFQDDQWKNSSAKSTDNKIALGKNDNLFDAWNDFPSSSTSQDPFRSSWKHNNGSSLTPSVEQTSEPNLLSSTSNLQEMEFGNFSQQEDLSSGADNNQNDSSTVSNMLPEASDSNRAMPMAMGMACFQKRKADTSAEDGGRLEQSVKDEDILDATTSSKAEDVEMLMSQMHDLSFMLESKLSVPQS
ncbi:hypothetical protein CK203_026301 [Vitis vinifera]|uniref:Uncharacterized protein n=1 Tax=Vitis vinifera TaxID=29760 RepID=A0A438ILL2_VITVI|nr:hypothetical protein CK203_026301 [Vitis vinifera]